MADEGHIRDFRGPDQYAPRGASPRRQADPLAELARLIGQQDPFANTPHDMHPNAVPAQAPDYGMAESDHGRVSAMQDRADRYEDGAQGGYDAYRTAPGHGGYDDGHSLQDALAGHDTGHAAYAASRGQVYGDAGPQDYPVHGHGYQSHPQDRGYGQQADGYGPPPGFRNEPEANAQRGYDRYAAEDDLYEDAAQPRRRGGMLIVAGVLSLAVVGTASAYVFRTVLAPSTNRATPVIRADAMPTKILPTAQADSGKPIQERLGDRPGSERLVAREEQPVDIRDAAVASPRVVVPWATQASAGPPSGVTATMSTPPIASPQTTGSAGSASQEPKRIKTLAIRADQGTVSPESAARAAPPAPAGNARTAARSVSGAPLSLAPTASAEPAMPVAQRVASASNTVGSIPAMAARAAVPPSDGSGWMVQLSAQKSQEEAQSSFRAMQSKYSALGGRQAVIKRKDLGDKGVFYGAQVGPLSREDASQLCESLKAAGGPCMLQRN